jgi:hypothetical protein
MDQRRPFRDIDGLFRLINRMSAEATSREELGDEIKASGLEPERFVSVVRSRLDGVVSPANSNNQEAKRFMLPLISELKKLSKLSAIEVARKLGVPIGFLSAVERYPDVIPSSWRAELATRSERALYVRKDVVLAILETPLRLEVAPFNNRLSDKMVKYEDILEMSDMEESAKQFWLELARSI